MCGVLILRIEHSAIRRVFMASTKRRNNKADLIANVEQSRGSIMDIVTNLTNEQRM